MRPLLMALSSLVLSLVLTASGARAEKWPAIPPEQLQLARPVVDPEADAEALFWDVRAVDSFDNGTQLWHHVRIKVFNENGRQSQSRIDLPYDQDVRIDGVSARSVAPDGHVVELEPREVYERTLIKANRRRVRVKSFVLSGVEVGSIVEYRWHESRHRGRGLSGILELQRDIPVHRITYHIQPIEFPGARLQYMAFNAIPTRLEREALGGFFVTSVARVPAYVEEPDMPPEREARQWMLIYYDIEGADAVQSWRTAAKELEKLDDNLRRDARDLRKAAAEIVGDRQDPGERLQRLYDYCRVHVANLQRETSGLSEEQRQQLHSNDHAKATFEAGKGTGTDINQLFAALAIASGFDARSASLGDREYYFVRKSMFAGFLSAQTIAVRVGDQWRFYDPASTHVSSGMLRWQEEDVLALIEEKGEPVWLQTPQTPAERSCLQRTGSFKLLEDGTLEGEGRIEYVGHVNVEEKNRLEGLSHEERDKALRERLNQYLPSCELSDVHYEHLADPESALVLRYQLRAPGFAKTTGKRLFFQPAVFQHGRSPRYTTNTRRNRIYFHFPWSEQDSLVIELPAGYELEHPDVPADFDLADVCQYHVEMGTTHEGTRLVYRRQFTFGRYYFQTSGYESLKATFDAIHERDEHTLAARQVGAGGP